MTQMQKYEVPVLMKPLLPDDIKEKVVANLEKLAKSLGGKLDTKLVWGKKHLAYAIEKHQEGYYVFFTLELPGDKVSEFNAKVKLMNDVLRFMVIREDQL